MAGQYAPNGLGAIHSQVLRRVRKLLVSYSLLSPPVYERAPMSDTVIQPRPFGHPLAGQTLSGARMIMQVLADEGV
ncbi:MAG: hypothetical protein JWO52_8157, partial [Gammaproteobacteria bacterium]|nr:hypothetical protein [Gammaproteobacteria bacterium]